MIDEGMRWWTIGDLAWRRDLFYWETKWGERYAGPDHDEALRVSGLKNVPGSGVYLAFAVFPGKWFLSSGFEQEHGAQLLLRPTEDATSQ